ncbi:MAG: alpha/beta fold hydrolase [Ginsengibacter sp.]
MNQETISFIHENGSVDGIYLNAGTGAPLVIIINGHNGFYNYGLFPYLQQSLAGHGISSYSFNFSHGGIHGDADYFEEIDQYEKNCMRLEVEDVLCVLHNLGSGKFDKHGKVFLLAHSLGGVPAIFAAAKAQEESIVINGIVLVSTVKQLNFWPDDMIAEWKENTIYYKKNNRTKQLLPQGTEFLNEVLQSDARWNVEHEIKKLHQPILIIHGENDEAISVEHGRKLFLWVRSNNKNSLLKIVPAATHTYNTKHPFEGTSPQLEEMIHATVTFILA